MPPIPPITQALMLICTAGFFLDLLLRSFTGPVLLMSLSLWPMGSGLFMPWQPFSFFVVQPDFVALLFNMMAMYMFGSELERLWGTKRYVQFLFAAVMAAAVTFLLLSLVVPTRVPLVGASSVLYAMLAASAILFPDRTIMPLIPPIPMKQKTFVLGFGGIILLLSLFGVGGISSLAHLGGAGGAWLIIRYWRGQAPFPPRRRR